MKKIYSLLLMIAAVILFIGSGATKVYAQVDHTWDRSHASGTLPTWFGTDTERGIAYSPNNNRLFVASRAGGNNIYVLNAATGENILVEDPGNPGTFINKKLNVTGLTGGTYVMNDVEADDESAIFVCNLTVGFSTSAFKVYMWSNEDAAPVTIINQVDASLASYRVGDRFTVEGKLSDNSIKIYAVAKHASSPSKVLVWTTTDNGASWNYSILCDGLSATSNQPTVATIPGSTDLMFNGNVITPTRMSVTGTNLGAVPAAVVETNSNAMVTYTKDGKTYLITFVFKQSTDLPTNYGMAIISDITDITAATKIHTTPNLGTPRNLNGAGDIEIIDHNDGTFTFYVLATNNGIGAYTIDKANIKPVSTMLPFSAVFGTVSTAQTFTVEGTNLTGDITVNAPANYEISLDGSNFSASLNLPQTDGVVSLTTISVRSKADATDITNGDIVLSSPGAYDKKVRLTGAFSNSYKITYDKTIVKQGDQVLITATFNGEVKDTPTPKISLTGTADGLVATDMLKTSATVYTYTWTVGAGNGTLTPEVTNAEDINSNPIVNNGAVRPNLTVDNVLPTYIISYTQGGQSVTSVKLGSTAVTIRVEFSENVLNAPVPQISLSGSITLSATNLTRVDSKTYTYALSSLGTTTGTVTPEVTLAQDAAGNVVTNTGSTQTVLTIEKGDQTITFNSLTAKTFGDAAFDLTATASSGLGVTYESSNTNVATISGSTVTIVGAGTTTITASQAGNDNYNAATPVEQGLTVNKADQAITFNALDAKTFGDAAFDLTATASSGLGVTYESSNTNVATISGSTVTIVGGGTATITASQAGNDNYNAATPVEQTLTVNKADQTITFGALAAKTTADAPFGLTATASSGLDVSYASSNTAVATISGSTVTIIAAGTTNITASQAGNDNYNAATDVIQQLTVTSSTGIEEIMAREIRVYPVPAQEYIFVDLGNLKSSKASLKLVDITGKTIIELKMKNSLEKIELNGLQSGVYFLNVQLDDKMIVKRLMVK